MKRNLLYLIAIVLICLVNRISAQQISNSHDIRIVLNKFSVLSVIGGKSIMLTLDENQIDFDSASPKLVIDNSKYLQYTVLTSSDGDQKIQAKISNGALDDDVQLKLSANIPSGHRNTGVPMQEITMSSTYQDIIKSINSCKTGTGSSDGAQLSFSMESTDWETTISHISGQIITLDFIILDE